MCEAGEGERRLQADGDDDDSSQGHLANSYKWHFFVAGSVVFGLSRLW